jgi:hypothetical protein
MKKEELKTGMRVERRDSSIRFVIEGFGTTNNHGLCIEFYQYNNDLTYSGSFSKFDIMKIYAAPARKNKFIDLDYKGDLLWERQEVPEYVECIEMSKLTQHKKGDIYKTIHGRLITVINSHGMDNCSWTNMNELLKKFKPSTKPQYEAQQEQIRKDELLEEAKRRYPVGTEFRVAHNHSYIRLVTGHRKYKDTFYGTHINLICKPTGDGCKGASVYTDGVWAEIIQPKKEITIQEIEDKLGYPIKIVK